MSNVNEFRGLITVKSRLALLLLPSAVVAVIVAVPAVLHVTITAVPLAVVAFDTVATFVLLDVQFTFLLFAFAGPTVGVIIKVSPIFFV